MNSNQITDPKLKAILNQLKNFGFEFYSFDEDGTPLVKGPNEQVVGINIAIQFANRQIEANRNSSGSMEQPEAPPTLDSAAGKIETSTERAIELKESISEEEKSQSDQPKQPGQDMVVPKQAPKVALKQPKIEYYGEGFVPVSFDPSNLAQTQRFVSNNVSKPPTTSAKWMAEQFRKFLEEIKAQS